MNWGKEQAEKHRAETGHATIGNDDRWTCAECDVILLELIPPPGTQPVGAFKVIGPL